MAYTKQNFENGQILTAEQLNHMEQGIAAPDWNDMTNKPFTTVAGDTLTWNGNTEGLETFDGMYKVADNVITMDMLSQGAIVTFNGQTASLADYLYDAGNGAIMFDVGMFLSVDMDDPESGTTLSKGVYFAQGVSGLTINGYTGFVKEQIKPDALPDGIGAQPDWNQNSPDAPDYIKNKPFYDLEPWIPPVTLPEPGAERMEILGHMIKENTKYVVNFNGTDYECESFTLSDFQGDVYLGNFHILVSGFEDNGLPFLLRSTIHVNYEMIEVRVDDSLTSCTISIRIASEPAVVPIPVKYFPNNVPHIKEEVGKIVPAKYVYDGVVENSKWCYFQLPQETEFSLNVRMVKVAEIDALPYPIGNPYPEGFEYFIGSTVRHTEFVEYDESAMELKYTTVDDYITSAEPVEGAYGGFALAMYSKNWQDISEMWGAAPSKGRLAVVIVARGDIFFGDPRYPGTECYMAPGIYVARTGAADPDRPLENGGVYRALGYVNSFSVPNAVCKETPKINKIDERCLPSVLTNLELTDSNDQVFKVFVDRDENDAPVLRVVNAGDWMGKPLM